MDQLFSQLKPTLRVGNDGFNWWMGQIEGTARDEINNKGGYRFKVGLSGIIQKILRLSLLLIYHGQM